MRQRSYPDKPCAACGDLFTPGGSRALYCASCLPGVTEGRVHDHHLQTTYGITLEEYETLIEGQGGVCAICGRPPKVNRLHTDHDHVTLLVRGALCYQCNANVIKRHHTGELLRRAADYLDNPPAIAIIGERFAPKRKPKRRRKATT